MSERTTINHEQLEDLLDSPEQHLALPTPEAAEKLRPGEADPTKRLAEARAMATKAAETTANDNPLRRHEAAEQAKGPSQPQYINRELKAITLRRELQQLRRSLPAPERALSKVVHQPVVRAISETAGKSLTRPSGLLGGGLVAFLGTSSYVYLAKHLGFTYNYFVFFLLLVVGFIIGLLLEFIVWAVTARHRHTDY